MRYLAAFLLSLILFSWSMLAFGAADSGVDIDAMAQSLNQLIAVALPYLPESCGGWVTMAVTIGAVFAAVVPRPKDNANIVWRVVYAIMNALGCNVARAKNASAVSGAASMLKNLKKK